jgi:hypothetical protein
MQPSSCPQTDKLGSLQTGYMISLARTTSGPEFAWECRRTEYEGDRMCDHQIEVSDIHIAETLCSSQIFAGHLGNESYNLAKYPGFSGFDQRPSGGNTSLNFNFRAPGWAGLRKR